MEHKNRSNASNVENEGSDDSIRIECDRALNARRQGDYRRALKGLNTLCRRYESSALVHRMQGSIHAELAELVDDTDAREWHLKCAAASGRKAVTLSPNSVEYAQFYASALWELADNSEQYNEVIRECERGLSIQCPSDPAKDNLDVEKQITIRNTTLQRRIRFERRTLEDLLDDAKKEISYLRNKRRESLKVGISVLKAHFISAKIALAVNVISEAIIFAKEKKTWRFWRCCLCDKKFGHFIKLREHLLNDHIGFSPDKLPCSLPKPVGPYWVDMLSRGIRNGTWKPVDISAAISLMNNQPKQQSSDSIDADRRKDIRQAHKWPLSDHSERTQDLERIHCLFRLLLKHRCLSKSHLKTVLAYTMRELQLIVPSSQLMIHGLNKTPHCIRFLGNTQLKWIAKFLQDMANCCSLKEEPDGLSPVDHNMGGIQTITVKERLSLTDDSYLLLDDRILKGELKPSLYDTALAHDGSTSPPADDDHEEVVLDNAALLEWLLSGCSVKEELSTWMQLMEIKKSKGIEYFHMLEEEFKQLEILCDIKYGHLSYGKALQAIEVMLTEENKKRETDSVFSPQSYMSLLRKHQEELVKRETGAVTFSAGRMVELDAISNILMEAQALRANLESEDDNEWKVDEDLDQEDTCVAMATNIQKDQNSKEVLISDVRIMQSIDSMHQAEHKCGSVSLHDFRIVLVPLLRSFLQAHMEKLFDKALARAQEDEVMSKNELEEERNHEGTLENQRQIEEGHKLIAQQKVDQCLGYNGSMTLGPLQVDDEVDEERFQADLRIAVCRSFEAIEAQGDLCMPEQKEQQKLSLQEDSRANDKIEPYVIGLQNDVGEYNCFLNVIIQSLWHLREFRDEFLSRPTSVHVHVGDPCVVCALYNVLTALSTAPSDVQRKAVSPTPLRIALSNLYPDSNFFQESQMNDASEVLAVIFDCLHQSFPIGSAVSHCESEESKSTGSSWDCTNNTCIAHTLFGMDIDQRMECSNCGIQSRQLKYTSFFRNINASSLRVMKSIHSTSSFDELLKLVEMEDQLACDPEAGGCGTLNHIRHILSTPPHVFTIGWQTTSESLVDISATLSALATVIDIGVLYQGLGPGKRYCLLSVVCYCGLHYYCFAYNHEHDRWIMFNDKRVKEVGFWVDVLTICERGLLQPQILFFEAIK